MSTAIEAGDVSAALIRLRDAADTLAYKLDDDDVSITRHNHRAFEAALRAVKTMTDALDDLGQHTKPVGPFDGLPMVGIA